MPIQMKQAAKELLDLERLYQKNVAFGDEQRSRWEACVSRIFGEGNATHGRRSFRLPGQLPCSVKIGQGVFECSALEVSRLGMTLAGPILRHITIDHAIELLSLIVDGADVAIGLACRVARLDPSKEPPLVGVAFSPDVTSDQRQRFFDVIYYPLYMRYLESLAG